MLTRLVYLRPKSSVAAWLSSDTIFGAIFWTLRHLYGIEEVKNWLRICQGNQPQIAVSSAFPFIDTEPPIHFLPKPLSLNPTAEIVGRWRTDRAKLLKAMEFAKKVSKANFVSEKIFAQAAKGELKAENLLEGAMDEQFSIRGDCLFSTEEATKVPNQIWVTTDTQHTAIDRVLASAAEGMLYFDNEHFFAPKVGLYFLLRCPDDFPVEAILRFLNHSGIGGNRSVGKGHFEWNAEPAEDWLAKVEAQNGDGVVLLSRCIPKPNEFEWQKSLYWLASRRPKFESAYGLPKRVYKGIVRQILEGSVLCPLQIQPSYGQLVKVGEIQDWDGVDFPVYHNGIGFPVRVVMP